MAQRFEWQPMAAMARMVRDRDDALPQLFGQLDSRMRLMLASVVRRGEIDPLRPARRFLPVSWSATGVTASQANTAMDLPPGAHTVWFAPEETVVRRLIVMGNDPVLAGRAKVTLLRNGNRYDLANAALTAASPSVAQADISEIEGANLLEIGDSVGFEIETDAALVLAAPPASYDVRALLEVVT